MNNSALTENVKKEESGGGTEYFVGKHSQKVFQKLPIIQSMKHIKILSIITAIKTIRLGNLCLAST